jgi:hypothetical protein
MKIILNTMHIIITMNPRNIKFQTMEEKYDQVQTYAKTSRGKFQKTK